MNQACVSLEEVLAAAGARAASLVPETSGYLALAVADATSRLPYAHEDRGVLLTIDGSVMVPRKAPIAAPPEAARVLRDLLRRLLAASTGSMPGLASAARVRSEEHDVDRVVSDIEAALIPVNRAAAKRALARLSRETLRAKELGKLKKKSAPPPAPSVTAPAVKIPAPPPPATIEAAPAVIAAPPATAPVAPAVVAAPPATAPVAPAVVAAPPATAHVAPAVIAAPPATAHVAPAVIAAPAPAPVAPAAIAAPPPSPAIHVAPPALVVAPPPHVERANPIAASATHVERAPEIAPPTVHMERAPEIAPPPMVAAPPVRLADITPPAPVVAAAVAVTRAAPLREIEPPADTPIGPIVRTATPSPHAVMLAFTPTPFEVDVEMSSAPAGDYLARSADMNGDDLATDDATIADPAAMAVIEAIYREGHLAADDAADLEGAFEGASNDLQEARAVSPSPDDAVLTRPMPVHVTTNPWPAPFTVAHEAPPLAVTHGPAPLAVAHSPAPAAITRDPEPAHAAIARAPAPTESARPSAPIPLQILLDEPAPRAALKPAELAAPDPLTAEAGPVAILAQLSGSRADELLDAFQPEDQGDRAVLAAASSLRSFAEVDSPSSLRPALQRPTFLRVAPPARRAAPALPDIDDDLPLPAPRPRTPAPSRWPFALFALGVLVLFAAWLYRPTLAHDFFGLTTWLRPASAPAAQTPPPAADAPQPPDTAAASAASSAPATPASPAASPLRNHDARATAGSGDGSRRRRD